MGSGIPVCRDLFEELGPPQSPKDCDQIRTNHHPESKVSAKIILLEENHVLGLPRYNLTHVLYLKIDPSVYYIYESALASVFRINKA